MNKEYNQLISAITLKEGKKKQVSIGNVREVLKVLKTLCKEPAHFHALMKYLVEEK